MMALKKRLHLLSAMIFSLCSIFGLMAILTTKSLAAPSFQGPVSTPTPGGVQDINPPEQLSIANEVCLKCHGKPGQEMKLENGEVLELFVDPEDHAKSIHGELGYACVQCHREVGDYPHPPFLAADLRDATLKLNDACLFCHSYQAELNQDGVHARALDDGKREAAVCVDCHGSHTVQKIHDPKTGKVLPQTRQWIPLTCARCHSAIYEKYRNSVHGAALTDEGNPDVPTCIDCHGVHNIPDPTTNEFRLKSPDICAKCHTDPKIMNKYGISTQVLDTYVADFHGTTQLLFKQEFPDQAFNKPVCYDCHGIHDIARPDDPREGLQVRENLLKRCQVCHPNASSNFPDAWLSHYIPSPEKYPIVYYVDLFYKFLIPTVLGGMVVLVALDISKKARDWYTTQDKISLPNLSQKTAELLGSDSGSTAMGESVEESEENKEKPAAMMNDAVDDLDLTTKNDNESE